jgi:ATP/ADP translocase
MLDEMVFVPLDFESRFVGKEVIGVFGYRFGKSCMSLALSAFTAILPTFALKELSIMSSLVSVAWLRTAWSLSNLVPTRAEADQSYEKLKAAEKRKK